ncbi:MAG: hypothetical protein CMG74_11125 [Candidatus Marinimicrobia bacterium]|nr:hypothetical protein [Candidatus Neomarinimicrobiota bacterium]
MIYPKRVILLLLALATCFLACEDAEYQLDNLSDPLNLDLTPPAIFFHPSKFNRGVNDTFSVKLYSYDLPDVAGAHLQVLYDRGSLRVDSVITDTFFQIETNPLLFTDDVEGVLDVFLFSMPTQTVENVSGTDAMAQVYFNIISPGISELEYGDSTRIVNAQNNPVKINSYGKAVIDAQ